MSETSSDIENPKKRGHWSKEEHTRFVQGIQMYGKDWKKVVECVGTRSSNQIRSHAQKYFLKLEKKNKLSSTKTNLSGEAYLMYLQTLSYNAYLKFMMEIQRMYSVPRTIEIVKPVKIISGDEIYPEDQTKKHVKVA
ncbi:hypothetical protein SteCoe_14302 [Stentor coeruleus]|uniref:Uncharacterized protein n=1 Tax=Stentor coeruleus TaxID=5963 RepID=A0A1R2C6A6_9CILI|nr:hypothetical protein SteCoe_14302 [Stentor coeruleus]